MDSSDLFMECSEDGTSIGLKSVMCPLGLTPICFEISLLKPCSEIENQVPMLLPTRHGIITLRRKRQGAPN